MNTLERQALNHALRLIESIDSFEQYQITRETMTKLGIDNETQDKISTVVSKEFSEQKKKAYDAAIWIKSILETYKK